MNSDSGEEVMVDMKEVHWNNTLIMKLVDSVNDQVPPADRFLPYDKVEIDWAKVAEDVGMEAEKCEIRWHTVLKYVRTYRTLPEIMLDIQTQYSKAGIKKTNTDNRPVHVVQQAKETPKKKIRKVVNPNHPKRPPVSGYSTYCSEVMPQVVGFVGIQKFVKLSEMWKKLSDSEKANYNEKSRKLKKEYMRKVENYAEHHPEDETIRDVLTELQSRKKSRKRAGTNMVNNDSGIKSESNGDKTTNDDDSSHAVSTTKKRKISPSKKNSKKVRTAESVFIDVKIEGYRAEHPGCDDEYLTEKLYKKYAKLSESKKAKYEALAKGEN